MKIFFEQIAKIIEDNGPTAHKGSDLEKLIHALKFSASEELIKKLQDHSSENYVSPVLSAVEMLSKDDLAHMAETLVSLTSFKRRMSLDLETVGGPIDVAVISKKDGFVWVKRKHYFNSELNPNFFRK